MQTKRNRRDSNEVSGIESLYYGTHKLTFRIGTYLALIRMMGIAHLVARLYHRAGCIYRRHESLRHSGRPSDKERVAEYDAGPYKNFADDVMKGFASIVPPDADAAAIGKRW